MNYFIKMKSGASHTVTETIANSLTALLLKCRDERPQFVQIADLGITVNTDSIASIEREVKSIFL